MLLSFNLLKSKLDKTFWKKELGSYELKMNNSLVDQEQK